MNNYFISSDVVSSSGVLLSLLYLNASIENFFRKILIDFLCPFQLILDKILPKKQA